MKIVNLQQGSSEWLKFKKHRLGSTSGSIILGCNPYETIQDLWASFNSDIITSNTNDAMKHGIAFEDTARKALQIHVGEAFEPICGTHDNFDFISVSLDGISKDGQIIAEIKCPANDYVFYNHLNRIPRYYYAQIQHQLMVSNAKFCCFFSWFKGNHALHLIYPNHEFQTELLRRELYFYDCYLGKEEFKVERFSEYVMEV